MSLIFLQAKKPNGKIAKERAEYADFLDGFHANNKHRQQLAAVGVQVMEARNAKEAEENRKRFGSNSEYYILIAKYSPNQL